jgi:soluble lytic murein transglycosylase-like protein
MIYKDYFIGIMRLPSEEFPMSRLLCLLALSFGVIQGAAAEELAQQEADASAQTTEQISHLITQKFGVARDKAEHISAAVMSAASKYSLPPALLVAIISIESRFKEKARGANGATGLMQVVPAAHKQQVRNLDLTDTDANIQAGSAILHGYLELARGDLGAALKSYGGSKAYAEKVSLRAKSLEPQVGRGRG